MSADHADTRDRTEDTVECALCGEFVPRSRSLVSAGLGRICQFCHSTEMVPPDGDDDDDWDDDDWDDEDWDDED